MIEAWLSSTWKDMWFYDCVLEINYNILPSSKGNDTYIMDKYLSKANIKHAHRSNFNWCRFYIKTLRISQLSCAKGLFIKQEVWNGCSREDMIYLYELPKIPKPSAISITIWQNIISILFTNNKKNHTLHNQLNDRIRESASDP